jgi:hypothetical protein
MRVTVNFQRLADQQFNLVIRFIFLLWQVNNLALHTLFRLRIRGRFAERLVGRRGVCTGAGEGQQADDAFRDVFHSHSFLCQTVAITLSQMVFFAFILFLSGLYH